MLIADSCRRIDPTIKIILGGGFINTELRSLKDPRLSEFVDVITLDDGRWNKLTNAQSCDWNQCSFCDIS